MNALSCFYSAKMAVVFILMLSSATIDAQQNDKFFELMTAIGEHLGGEFNNVEKALELDLNGANSFLEGLHKFATREIVTKNENGEFECKESTEKPYFIKAIKTILGEDMINLLKVIHKNLGKEAYAFLTVLDEKLKPNKKVEGLKSLLKELSVKFSEKFYSEEQFFNLLFSFAARLEALVHGKNIDGTLKEKQENSKEKIQTFLAVPKCLIFTEGELSIFDYWIEIIKMKTDESQNPIFGVAIYKEKYDKNKSEFVKKFYQIKSSENYKILKQLNDQKFSIYESSNLLKAAFNSGYSPRRILRGEIPKIFVNLLRQIHLVFNFNWKRNEYWDKNEKCAYALFFQNISESLMKMISDKGIDPELHLDSLDKEIRKEVQKDVEESCKKFDNEEVKIIFLNNVRYDLAINFEFNQRKDVNCRAKDLLSNWVVADLTYLKKNAELMLYKIKDFTSEKTNREKISIIEALIGKEFNLGALFDQIKRLVEVEIPEEKSILKKAISEINTKQLEKDIKFLKNNPKSIGKKKYQKVVTIICTIKQLGEKVEMLTSKIQNIENIEIQEKLKKLSSTIQNYIMDYIGPKLWKQTEEFCNPFNQIEMEETVSEEILLADLLLEFSKIWKSSKGVWGGIEEYFLSIPLMQLTQKARTLAKTFGKMLKNVKELYAQ